METTTSTATHTNYSAIIQSSLSVHLTVGDRLVPVPRLLQTGQVIRRPHHLKMKNTEAELASRHDVRLMMGWPRLAYTHILANSRGTRVLGTRPNGLTNHTAKKEKEGRHTAVRCSNKSLEGVPNIKDPLTYSSASKLD